MKFTIDEIVRATDAKVLKCQNDAGYFSISTDTRTIGFDQIYLPLQGENFDGHNFINMAVEKGARGYFTSDKKLKIKDSKLILYVKDTLTAYMKLALYARKKFNPVTIAITGSSGKTTTKEMMAAVLAAKYKIHKSPLNHNNEVGLCQTILSMPKNTEVLILEMGMRGLGEIELLSKYSEPDIAMVINSGTTHIGRLGSIESIAAAKCEITSNLHKEGLFICHDTELLRATNNFKGQTIYTALNPKYLKIKKMAPGLSEFSYKNSPYKLKVEGEHNIQNALFVIETALKLGMPPDKIKKSLVKYQPIEKRWDIENICGYKIINDSYNANPDSVKAALSTFLGLYDGKKVVVLGDMKELGENEKKYHEEIGEFINQYKETELVTVGELAQYTAQTANIKASSFKTNSEAAKYINQNISKDTTILLKASRSMKFEEIILLIKELNK